MVIVAFFFDKGFRAQGLELRLPQIPFVHCVLMASESHDHKSFTTSDDDMGRVYDLKWRDLDEEYQHPETSCDGEHILEYWSAHYEANKEFFPKPTFHIQADDPMYTCWLKCPGFPGCCIKADTADSCEQWFKGIAATPDEAANVAAQQALDMYDKDDVIGRDRNAKWPESPANRLFEYFRLLFAPSYGVLEGNQYSFTASCTVHFCKDFILVSKIVRATGEGHCADDREAARRALAWAQAITNRGSRGNTLKDVLTSEAIMTHQCIAGSACCGAFLYTKECASGIGYPGAQPLVHCHPRPGWALIRLAKIVQIQSYNCEEGCPRGCYATYLVKIARAVHVARCDHI